MSFEVAPSDQSTCSGGIDDVEVLSVGGGIAELTNITQRSWYTRNDERLCEIENILANLEGQNVNPRNKSHLGQKKKNIQASQNDDCSDSLRDIINLLKSSNAAKLQSVILVLFLYCFSLVG